MTETGTTNANEMSDMDIFAEINEVNEVIAEVETVKEETIDIWKAIQICVLDSNGRREIKDTLQCNQEHDIIPIAPAKKKAEKLKAIFPKDTFMVVAVIHRVNKFKKIDRIYNILHTY